MPRFDWSGWFWQNFNQAGSAQNLSRRRRTSTNSIEQLESRTLLSGSPPVVANGQVFALLSSCDVGFVVGKIDASDPDIGQTLTYAITGPNNGAFSINSTGQLVVANKASLNALGTQTILVIQVTDNVAPMLSTSANITVIVNHPPVLNDVTFGVLPTIAAGDAVGTNAATDPDIVQALSYSIVAGNESNAFVIEPATGTIKVANKSAFDALIFPKSLAVEVRDTGNPQGVDTALVTVNRNFPPVVNDQSFTVPTTSPQGYVIGTVAVVNPENTQQLTYVFTTGNESGALEIDSNGKLSILNKAAFDALPINPSFTLTVRDNGVPQGTDTAVISLLLNTPPVIADQIFNVPSTVAIGAEIGLVAAFDAETASGQTLTYKFNTGNETGAFAINSQTGKVTIANVTAFNSLTLPHSLTVQVQDSVTPPSTASAKVTITSNHPPVIANQTFSVLSSSPTDTVLGTVIASDPDLGQFLTFELVAGSDYNGAFSISSTGILTVKSNVPLGALVPQAVLSVKVTDSGSPKLSSIAQITIVINHPPTFLISNQTFTVPGTVTTGYVVGTAAATDPEVGQILTYTIITGNNSGAWAINSATGTISLANKAIYDSISLPVDLTIEVRDNGTLPGITTTVVKINGNHPPVVENQEFAAPLTGNVDTVIGTVYATDADELDKTKLNYGILAGNETGAFKIDAATGAIKIANKALYEALTFPRTLTVQVTDAGTPTLFDTAVITLKRNVPPVVENQEFVVPLNAQDNAEFATVQAIDSDGPAGGLHYLIISGNESGAFAINPTSGALSVTQASKLAAVAFPVKLTVQVRDNGNPQGTDIAIITLNGNHTPELSDITLTVHEGELMLGTLVATDVDLEQTLTYQILPGPGADTVAINATTGKLAILEARKTDFANLIFPVKLQIKVTDTGTPQASTIAVVTLVRSATNAADVIHFDAQTFRIPLALPANAVVGSVFAYGKTTSSMVEPLTLRYSLPNATDRANFSIDSSTGVLTSRTTPTASTVIQVTVSDLADLNTYVTRPVAINTVDTANHLPTAQNLDLSIPENSGARTPVGKVIANPMDVGEKLTFAILDTSLPRAFTINSKTGEITVNDDSLLDYEKVHVIYLNVKVTDDGQSAIGKPAATNKAKPLSTFVTVTIRLVDVLPENLNFDLDPNHDPHETVSRTHHIGDDPTRLAPEAVFRVGAGEPLFNGVTLKVSASSQIVRRNDRLLVVSDKPGPGNISVIGNSILYDKTVIGMFTGGKGKVPALTITFNSSATESAVQALVRRLGLKAGGAAGERQIKLEFSPITISTAPGTPPRTVTPPSQTQIVNVIK